MVPLKKITIPRMELTAATVAVRVNSMIHQNLDVPIDETFFGQTAHQYLTTSTMSLLVSIRLSLTAWQ